MFDFLWFIGWVMGGMLFILMIMGLSVLFLFYFWGFWEVGIFGVIMSFVVVFEYVVGFIIMV